MMMDESRVVPKGSHFVFPVSHDGVNYNLRWRHRCTVAPVDYFYIDFGLSMWHPDGHESATAIGVVGQLKDIPELSATVPYNPFKLDICQLGRTILEVIEVSNWKRSLRNLRTYVKQVYPDLRIFVPLAEKMSRREPNDRPTATEALAEFETVVSSISRRKLRARIWRIEDTLAARVSRFVHGIPAL
jgi:hypothetical protein